MPILTRNECYELHKKNAGQLVWLDFLAVNDCRIIMRNKSEILYTFISAEYDQEEQAQAARLCAAINSQRSQFVDGEDKTLSPIGGQYPQRINKTPIAGRCQ